MDSLLSESPGKLKNTGVGSLSLLQGNFPTQELNRGLLQFRQILYQLSCQRSKNTGTKSLQSCLTLATPWTVARQTPLSMGSPRQEYWSGLPFPSPGDLPKPGIKPASPALQADSLPTELRGKPPSPLLATNYGSIQHIPCTMCFSFLYLGKLFSLTVYRLDLCRTPLYKHAIS